MIEYYSSSLAQAFRAVMKMVQASYPDNQGVVVLDSHLSLRLPTSRVAVAKQVILTRYRRRHHSDDTEPSLLLEQRLRQETPVYVCDLLYECANTVDQIVAVANTLEIAASLLDEHGWVQGSTRDGLSMCMLGALEISLMQQGLETYSWYPACKEVLSQYLQTKLLVEWNDAPGRTAREVLHVLRETAAGIRIIKP